jgi:ubiquinol-cytochrome c reductase subunit 6
MIFKKKKNDEFDEELDALGDDEEIIDFKEFEEFEEKAKREKGARLEDIEKNFIFHVPRGCPICGGDVKGNDHYRYFCEQCNVLFDKKDILEKEFGKSVAEVGKVRKTRLSDDERAELERKRKELKERVFKTFTQQEKRELVEEAEGRKEEELPEPEPEPEPEADDTTAGEETAEETPADTEEEQEPEAEPELGEGPEPGKGEYGLESADKVIASKESTKMHSGACHFVKKIHPQNRIYLGSTEQGEEQGYEMCVCLRRMKAKQR